MLHTFKTSPVSSLALVLALALLAPVPAAAQLVGDEAPPPSSPLRINGVDAAPDEAEEGDARETRRDRRGRGGRSGRRAEVHPYIEVGQVVSADLSNGGDVLTYSTVAVGVQASVETRRAQASADVRYERRFGWNDKVQDSDVISGLARGAYALGGGLSLEAGALASRASIDGRGGSANFGVGDQSNQSTIYSLYAGPTFARTIGDLDVGGAYRFGYSRNELDTGTSLTGTNPFGTFDEASNHSVLASVGMRPGNLPFGWRLSGGYDYEKAGQLDQRYRGAFGRADITLPVTPVLALVGGVGYEDIRVSNAAPLIDAGTGRPVVDGRGRLVSDPAQPRQIAFETDGLIYDAGVLWRPSRRLSVEARVGRRYGDMSYTGSATWQESEDVGYQLGVYDSVSTIGRSLSAGLATLPTDFSGIRNGIDGSLSGCAFGSGGGTCLTPALNNVTGFAFHNRGAVFSVSSRQRLWTLGAALGYDRRTYLARGVVGLAGLNGSVDETWYAAFTASRPIGESTSFGATAYATLFDSGLAGAGNTTSAGISSTLSHIFFPRLTGSAAVSLDAVNPDNRQSRIFASALFGLRYTY